MAMPSSRALSISREAREYRSKLRASANLIPSRTKNHLSYSLHHSKAKAPIKYYKDAAGFDLSSIEDIKIRSGKVKAVDLGISLVPPKNTYVQLASRSSLAIQGILVISGVCDRDYRGTIKCLLLNTTDRSFTVRCGDRICQGIIMKISKVNAIENKLRPQYPTTPECFKEGRKIIVKDTEEEHTQERGNKGFGSTNE